MKFAQFVFFLLLSLSLNATPIAPEAETSFEEVQDELHQLDALVQATEERLSLLQTLQKKTEEFRKVEKQCVKKPNDTMLLYQLADLGKEIYASIEQAGLHDYLSPAFVKDLEKLAIIANKQNIPPVR
jgi:predicted DNA-binding protein YlxM (UPF0122 family)